MSIDQLIEKIQTMENPTVVGLDPRLSYIPTFIKQKAFREFGKTPKGAAEAYFQFNKEIIDAIWDIVPAVKPQIAMYEALGAEGIDCFIRTCQYAKKNGLQVIGDCKRSDIASTAEAYASHIGQAQIEEEKITIYEEDFITLNPYMGWDSIEPYLENCKTLGKGLFILVKTSNPFGGQIQDLLSEGRPIYEKVGLLVEEWGKDLIGKFGYSSIGAVVGATYPKQGEALRALLPHTFFLVPGYGAQGAKAEDIAGCFDKNGQGAIVNSSRGILAAYQKEPYQKFGEENFQQAARQAAIDMKNELRRCLA